MIRESILAMETSVTDASLVLSIDGEIIARESYSSERSQEVDLFKPLQKVLAALPAGQVLSSIIVGTGPGSYNGARVGIATAQAIAQVHGCGVAGICSFEGVPEVQNRESAQAIGDARRGSFFIINLSHGQIQDSPTLLAHDEFQKHLSNSEGPIVTFEPVERLRLEDIEVTQSNSNAETLLQSWVTRSEEEKEALLKIPPEAFYLRPPHITKSKKKPLLD